MRLAALRRTDQDLDLVTPLRPGVNQPDGGESAIADKEIFGAERGAVGQVEGELCERHETLTRGR